MTGNTEFNPVMEGVRWTEMAISGFAGVVACRNLGDGVEVDLTAGLTFFIYRHPQGEDYMSGATPRECHERTFTLEDGKLTIEPPMSPLSVHSDGASFGGIVASAIWNIKSRGKE